MRSFTIMAEQLLILSCAMLILLSLLGELLLSLPFLVLTLLLMTKISKANRQSLGDLLIFTESILLNYSKGRSTAEIVRKSLNPKFSFYKSAIESLKRSRLSGSAMNAFSWISGKSQLCKEVFFAIIESIDAGTSIKEPIEELHSRIKEAHELSIKSLGSVANSYAISSIGSSVFFPIFAGISLYIIRFSAGIGGSLPMPEWAFSLAILLYVAEMGAYNAIGKRSGEIALSALSSLAIGTFLYKASYLFALYGLRW